MNEKLEAVQRAMRALIVAADTCGDWLLQRKMLAAYSRIAAYRRRLLLGLS